ncbi:MAG: MFS transporter [Pseudomonadota bacterium]
MRLSTLDSLRAQIAPVAAITVFGLSIAMSYPLLALLLERMGASGFWIGVNTTAAAISMVVFAPILPRIMARTGLSALMLGSGLALAVIMIGYAVWANFAWWTALRILYGFCATALFFTSEFWIVAAAPAGARGRVVAAYTIALSLSFMTGPLLVNLTGIDGVLPFAVASLVVLAGLVPIVWGLKAMPGSTPEVPPSPRATLRFFVTDPGILWAVVLFGLIEYGAVALLPVWAVRSGLSETQAIWLLASFAAGSVLSAPFIGAVADRADRRLLLVVVATVAMVAPVAMALVPGFAGALFCGVLWGAAAVGLYTLPLVELGARYAGHRLAEGNGAVILAYGLGALLSPSLLGAAMDAVPPNGLLWLTALVTLGYLGLILHRRRHARRKLDSAASLSQ